MTSVQFRNDDDSEDVAPPSHISASAVVLGYRFLIPDPQTQIPLRRASAGQKNTSKRVLVIAIISSPNDFEIKSSMVSSQLYGVEYNLSVLTSH